MTIKRRTVPVLLGLPPRRSEEPRLSCVLLLNKQHAEDLCDLLEKGRASSLEPHRFDKTPLGEVLQALKSGGRIG